MIRRWQQALPAAAAAAAILVASAVIAAPRAPSVPDTVYPEVPDEGNFLIISDHTSHSCSGYPLKNCLYQYKEITANINVFN